VVCKDNARNNGHKDLPVYNTLGVNHKPDVTFIVRCIPMPKNTGDHQRCSLSFSLNLKKQFGI
jgi:hypothetical protein